VLYFSISSYYINTHWKTEESFWQQSARYGATALAHQNYALAIVGKHPELAEHHYLEAIRQVPAHVYANINLGMLQIRTGREEEGLRRLKWMVKLNPNRASAHYWLSAGLNSTGQKDEALKEIVLAADSDTRSLWYQYKAARALQNAGKRAESIPYFERIIGLDPDFEQTEFWLGFSYQKTGQSQKAIDMYNRFLQSHPNHAQSHFNLAHELKSVKDYNTAVVHFKKTLELKPSYRAAHLHLSICYRVLGNEELAAHHESIYESKN
jgi:tetratricopeptide (TPR) repeat protein